MRPHADIRARRGSLRRLASLAVALPLLLLLSGCTKEVERGWLPSTRSTTEYTDRIITLWNGTWIAALLVGALVWGLMIWCIVAYRRRKDETGFPAQIRYHVPLEIMYTLLPLMMVGTLFFYTARDQAAIADTSKPADLTINVVGKQWSWDFNYLTQNVYEIGLQGELNGKPGVEKQLPTLYLPQGKRVKFILTSRDVIHSFWVPSFLYKLDVIPGLENQFEVTPQVQGTFKGKCAELCGEYHSEMLFNVKVVSPEEFQKHMDDLKAQGKVGRLDANLGRSETRPGGAVPGNPQTAATGSNG